MKKLISIILMAAMVTVLLAGCQTSNQPNTDDTTSGNVTSMVTDDMDATDGSLNDDTDAGTIIPATNPSEGYNNFLSVKTSAYDRISVKTETYTDISFTILMNMLTIITVDLELIPLTVFTGQDEVETAAALSILGMSNVNLSSSGDTYTITYNSASGSQITQMCQYDASPDQMVSVVTDGSGKELVFFEYVNLGDAYVSQYYYYGETDGLYYLVTGYFNDSNIAAFGISTSSSKPDSILGGSNFSEEFVKNDEMYMILKDDVLTVFDNGTVTTH